MKIIFLMILFVSLYTNVAFSSDNTIYTADIELIITKIKDYPAVNTELNNYAKTLSSNLEDIRNGIMDKKSKESNLEMLNPIGRVKWSDDIIKMEQELSIRIYKNNELLVKKERSLKFPLIKKLLEFIQISYDKKSVNFIVDPDAIFFYKKESTKVIDLTDEIINDYNNRK